jgi:hypothetical protein
MKGGGAEIRVLDRARPNLNGENWRGKIVESARNIGESGDAGSELVGYVMVGMFSDGTSMVGFAYDAARSPIPRALMPSWVAEVIRRDFITSVEAEDVACRVVSRANGFPGE